MTDSKQPPVVYRNRVRFQETDMQGIVFYGTFFTFQDEAFNGYFRKLGHPYKSLTERGWETHTVHAELDYFVPAEFEDCIANRLRFSEINNSSLTAEYIAERESDGEQLAAGKVIHVAVDTSTGEPTRVPQYFRDAVVEFQTTPPKPV